MSRKCLRLFSVKAPAQRFNILFLGQDEFSCTVFQHLYEASDIWKEITVATNADTKTGRHGRDLWVSPLKTIAKSLGITHHHVPPKTLGMKAWLVPEHFRKTAQHPDNVLITASFGGIIPPNILNLFAQTRRLNVHPSLVPQYRGPAPIQHAIMDGHTETGVSIISLEPYRQGVDAGNVWMSSSVAIPLNSTFESLRPILGTKAGRSLVTTLRNLATGTATSTPQKDTSITHAPFISRNSAMIQWDIWDAYRLDRVHRGINHQCALVALLPYATVELKKFTIRSPPAALHPRLREPGDAIYDPQTKAVVVRCANDTEVSVTRLQQEYKRERDAIDFWNGVRSSALHDDGLLKLGSLTPNI